MKSQLGKKDISAENSTTYISPVFQKLPNAEPHRSCSLCGIQVRSGSFDQALEYSTSRDFENARVTVPEGNTLSSATMYYITTDELAFGGGKENIGWQTVSEYTFDEGVLSMNVPAEATHLYVSVTDESGYIISSEFIKVK